MLDEGGACELLATLDLRRLRKRKEGKGISLVELQTEDEVIGERRGFYNLKHVPTEEVRSELLWELQEYRTRDPGAFSFFGMKSGKAGVKT